MKPNKTLTIKAKTEHKCTEKPGTIYEQFYETSHRLLRITRSFFCYMIVNGKKGDCYTVAVLV